MNKQNGQLENKVDEFQNLDLKSEEVQDILSTPPSWMIRWGITLIFIIAFLGLLTSWFIKYPETITSNIVITTEFPPASLNVKSNGNLLFFVKDNSYVEKGQEIAIVENTTNFQSLKNILPLINTFQRSLYIQDFINDTLNFPLNIDLGQIQAEYIDFVNSVSSYRINKNLSNELNEINALNRQISYYREIIDENLTSKNLFQEELKIAEEKLKVDSVLWKEDVISTVDFNSKVQQYLALKRSFEQTNIVISQNHLQIEQIKASIESLKRQFQLNKFNQFEGIKRSFKNLKNSIQEWRERYIIQSPLAGRITYVNHWSEKQYVQVGQSIALITPKPGEIFGLMQTPILGSGRLKVGQEVHIKLLNYPSKEFGIVEGEISSISEVPVNEVYFIRVRLPSKLLSSYGKTLAFNQEMRGTANVITEDLRLLERILFNIKPLFNS